LDISPEMLIIKYQTALNGQVAPMVQTPLLKTILHTDWISWIIHFFMFLVLARWSGIKWIWAFILVLSIEVWETADWSLARPLQWWMRLDTYLDILSGSLGIWIAERMKRSRRRQQKN
jgi:hypothetical protein